MQPTRRGYGAAVAAALAVAMGWLAGPRALNAAAVPVLVALAAGFVQVSRAGAPDVERTRPRRGFPGETRTVALSVDGGGVARVEDRLPAGLSSVPGGAGGDDGAPASAGEAWDGRADRSARFERTLPATVEYEVTFERRGAWRIGPARVVVRDVLGLVRETYEVGGATEVVVFPQVYSIDAASVFGRALGPEVDDRTEFDRLREYVPGDRLRDVHWKTSAKYDELLVTEYSDPTDDETVTVVAEGEPAAADVTAAADEEAVAADEEAVAADEGVAADETGPVAEERAATADEVAVADEMAAAAATLFVGAMRAGLPVELRVPSGSLPPGYGETHRRHGLDLLARTTAGAVTDQDGTAADVHVRASEGGVTVTVGDDEYALDALRTDGDRDDRPAPEVSA